MIILQTARPYVQIIGGSLLDYAKQIEGLTLSMNTLKRHAAKLEQQQQAWATRRRNARIGVFLARTGKTEGRAMKIGMRIRDVSGTFDTECGEIKCVVSKKHAEVDLCFKAGMNIPFAAIKLHSADRWVDAEAVFDDASLLGYEIEKRWSEYRKLEQANKRIAELEAEIDALKERLADR